MSDDDKQTAELLAEIEQMLGILEEHGGADQLNFFSLAFRTIMDAAQFCDGSPHQVTWHRMVDAISRMTKAERVDFDSAVQKLFLDASRTFALRRDVL